MLLSKATSSALITETIHLEFSCSRRCFTNPDSPLWTMSSDVTSTDVNTEMLFCATVMLLVCLSCLHGMAHALVILSHLIWTANSSKIWFLLPWCCRFTCGSVDSGSNLQLSFLFQNYTTPAIKLICNYLVWAWCDLTAIYGPFLLRYV